MLFWASEAKHGHNENLGTKIYVNPTPKEIVLRIEHQKINLFAM